MKAIDDDTFELSNGKRIYAHRLMLGITQINGKFEFGYGADGDLPLTDYDYFDGCFYFSKSEQREVAEYAIEMWRNFLVSLEK